MATAATAPGYADLLAKGFKTWPEGWGHCNDGDQDPQQPYKCGETNSARKRSGGWTSGSSSPAHGTLNGMGQWFVAGVGGIRRAPAVGHTGYGGVGYGRFEVRPAIAAGGLRSATASFASPYGLIRSSWSSAPAPAGLASVAAGQMNVTVPPNTVADVYIPAPPSAVYEGGVRVAAGEAVGEVDGVRAVRAVRQAAGFTEPGAGSTRAAAAQSSIVTVGSGTYHLTWGE